MNDTDDRVRGLQDECDSLRDTLGGILGELDMRIRTLETVENENGTSVLTFKGLYDALALHPLALLVAVSVADSTGCSRYVPLMPLGPVTRARFREDLRDYAYGEAAHQRTNAYIDRYCGALAIIVNDGVRS